MGQTLLWVDSVKKKSGQSCGVESEFHWVCILRVWPAVPACDADTSSIQPLRRTQMKRARTRGVWPSEQFQRARLCLSTLHAFISSNDSSAPGRQVFLLVSASTKKAEAQQVRPLPKAADPVELWFCTTRLSWLFTACLLKVSVCLFGHAGS